MMQTDSVAELRADATELRRCAMTPEATRKPKGIAALDRLADVLSQGADEIERLRHENDHMRADIETVKAVLRRGEPSVAMVAENERLRATLARVEALCDNHIENAEAQRLAEQPSIVRLHNWTIDGCDLAERVYAVVHPRNHERRVP